MNPVEISCICPGTPHERDTVTLKDPLDFRTAITVRTTIGTIQDEAADGMTVEEYLAALVEVYLIYCIEAWSLVDGEGKPVPVSKAAIRTQLLPDLEAASLVGEEADRLYTKRLILPLLAGASISLPPSSTDGSTSATSGTGTTPRKRSKPSSTSTTQTAGTAVMTT